MHRNTQYSERQYMHNLLRNLAYLRNIQTSAYAELSVVRMLKLFLKPRV